METIWKTDELSNHMHSNNLAAVLMQMFPKDKPILDLGCGLGFYIDQFSQYGYDVRGVEGTPGINNHSIYKGDIQEADLSKDFIFDGPKSNILCLEVGEHIEPQNEQTFLDNLVKYADDKIILSRAVPGQGGHGHYNEKSNEYIISVMIKRGFIINKEQTSFLREAMQADKLWWFKGTLMVFDRMGSQKSRCALENIGVDQIYLVNLQERADRLNLSKNEFNNIGLTSYKVFWGINAANLGLTFTKRDPDREKQQEDKIQMMKEMPYKKKTMAGIVGCFMSHFLIVREAVEKGYKRIIIFEDDVTFVSNFNEVFKSKFAEVPDDREICYLGWYSRNNGYGIQMITDNVCYAGNIWGTHGFMLQGEGIRKMYQFLSKGITNHIDVMMAQQMNNDMKAYCLVQPVCNQRKNSGGSNIV